MENKNKYEAQADAVIIGTNRTITNKLKEFLKTPNGKITLAVVVLFTVVIAYGLYNLFGKNNTPATTINPVAKLNNPTPAPTPKLAENPFNGALVSETDANKHAIAVMIENHPDARPQSGLTSANIVYEAITEGGITRFMGIFGSLYPVKAGPVRSARTPFLNYLKEYDAWCGHVGGSIDVIQNISKYSVKDLDEFANAKPYWREPRGNVAIEHTMYVNVQKLADIGASKSWDSTSGSFEHWQFIDDIQESNRPETQIQIVPYEGSYKIKWEYQKQENSYKRYQNDVVHRDRETKADITPKNVVIMSIPSEIIKNPADEMSTEINAIGSGKAIILQNGTKITGTWKKSSRDGRTKFYDSAGSEISFVRGQIWIQIVPQWISVE